MPVLSILLDLLPDPPDYKSTFIFLFLGAAALGGIIMLIRKNRKNK